MIFQFSGYIHWPLIILHLYVLCVGLYVHKVYIGFMSVLKYVQVSCSTLNIQLHSLGTCT